MKRIISSGFLFLLFSAVLAQEPGWIGSWGAAPMPPREMTSGDFQATRSFKNQTIRQFIRLSAGGNRVRLRLTNEYSAQPLKIGAATIARVDGEGRMKPDTMHTVTFGGQKSGLIPAGAPLLSDPVELSVSDLETLAISIYLPADTGQCTCHNVGLQTAYVSAQGDFTSTRFATDDSIQTRAFLSGVDVYSIESSHVIVVLGDSITDGFGSTPDTNSRWPDRLAEHLADHEGNSTWSVVNAGIAGNRILSDGAGESALARFDRDVLAVPGVTLVIVYEGINDIGFALGPIEGRLADYTVGMPLGKVTEGAMIAGYRQLIARAHSKGLMIFGATITPYNGSQYFSSEGENIRKAVNQWIRESGEFDAVFDFDAVLRDPAQPSRIAEGLNSGDFIHGNDAGYQRIADSIDIGLFELASGS